MQVVILGAGFGRLELATLLSSADEALDVVLIDKGDAFVFGYSKLDSSSRAAKWFGAVAD